MTSEFKITVLGGGAVGKSALTIRYITGEFEQIYDPTIEDSYSKQVGNDVIHILDTAGQEEFSALQDQWIRDGDGFVIVYSVTNKESIVEAGAIRDKIIRILDVDLEKQILPLVLVGNKCDLERERAISKQEGEDKGKEWKCVWMESSAKDRINVDKAFSECVDLIRKKKKGTNNKGNNNSSETKRFALCTLL